MQIWVFMYTDEIFDTIIATHAVKTRVFGELFKIYTWVLRLSPLDQTLIL